MAFRVFRDSSYSNPSVSLSPDWARTDACWVRPGLTEDHAGLRFPVSRIKSNATILRALQPGEERGLGELQSRNL